MPLLIQQAIDERRGKVCTFLFEKRHLAFFMKTFFFGFNYSKPKYRVCESEGLLCLACWEIQKYYAISKGVKEGMPQKTVKLYVKGGVQDKKYWE
jgi:hypothetical protein